MPKKPPRNGRSAKRSIFPLICIHLSLFPFPSYQVSRHHSSLLLVAPTLFARLTLLKTTFDPSVGAVDAFCLNGSAMQGVAKSAVNSRKTSGPSPERGAGGAPPAAAHSQPTSMSTPKYRGVYRSRSGNKWGARIWDASTGSNKYLGTFASPHEAVSAHGRTHHSYPAKDWFKVATMGLELIAFVVK